jgi:uncharacterized protein YecT (DUF1311 family)
MRTKTLLLSLALGMTFLSGPVTGGESQAEKLQKAKGNFAAADADLNKTFQTLRKKLPADEFKELRDQQRKWLDHRDYMSADQPRQNGFRGNDPKQSGDYWDSMAELTKARTEFLRASFDSSLPKGITGAYEDSYGGSLNLEERADGVAFQIEVVRGPTTHTGGLAGLATLKDGVALYKEKVDPGEDREPCELTFSFSKGRVVKVDGKNTEHYHGMRAYFVGTYFKVAKLDKPIDLDAPQD